MCSNNRDREAFYAMGEKINALKTETPKLHKPMITRRQVVGVALIIAGVALIAFASWQIGASSC